MRERAASTIRAASPDDATELTALMRRASAYQGEYAAMLHGYVVTAQQIEGDMFAVVEQGSQIVAFYALTDRDGPELDLMFVADAVQGSGVGRQLFDHMVQASRDRRWGVLKIVSHPPSEGFYLRMGAVRVGTEPAEGRIGWDRPILELAIGPR